jgi:Flp pilus assembly pilin Flp
MAACPGSQSTAGSIYTEYLVVLTLVAIVMVLAVVGLGGPFLEFFRHAEGVLLLPV